MYTFELRVKKLRLNPHLPLIVSVVVAFIIPAAFCAVQVNSPSYSGLFDTDGSTRFPSANLLLPGGRVSFPLNVQVMFGEGLPSAMQRNSTRSPSLTSWSSCGLESHSGRTATNAIISYRMRSIEILSSPSTTCYSTEGKAKHIHWTWMVSVSVCGDLNPLSSVRSPLVLSQIYWSASSWSTPSRYRVLEELDCTW